MSVRSEKSSSKSSSKLNATEEKTSANIFIKISQVEKSNDEAIKVEIVAKFMNNQIECIKLSDDDNDFRFQASYELKVDVDDAEAIFNLFANPVQLTLLRSNVQEKNRSTVGYTNVDLYPLCSDQIENHQIKLVFDDEACSEEKSQCFEIDVKITSDQPLLKTPRSNCLYVTFDSICNLETETAVVSFGMKASLESQFNKSVVFSIDTSATIETSNFKRWFSLSHIAGNGAESSFSVEPYNYPMTSDEEELFGSMKTEISLNAIGRIILTDESNDFFEKHVNKSMKIAVEVMNGENHLVGFIDAEDFNQVGRKRIRRIVPLKLFNTQSLVKNSDCVFYRPKPISKIRKSKKFLNKKSVKVSHLATTGESPDEFEEVLATNKDGDPVFIIVELELEKPLNEKEYEDVSDPLVPDALKYDDPQAPEKIMLESFRKNLQVVVKNVSHIYGKQAAANETVTRMINDGYFSIIEDHLLPEICAIGHKKFSASDDFYAFRDDFVCLITSHVLNATKTDTAVKFQHILIAQVYEFLGMDRKADETFLEQILQNDIEENWISYAIYNLRKEKFNKTKVCVDKAVERCSNSLVGHILMCYIEFKLKNFSECLRLISFLKLQYGEFLELSMMQHVISVKDKNVEFSEISDENFKHQPMIEEVYDLPEVLWFATPRDENFLNWHDPLIRSAILFIKIGCLEFAEILLEDYLEKHGLNINYSYLMSVVDAMKGRYHQSLIYLEQITSEDIGNHQLHYDKIVLLTSLMLVKLEDFPSAYNLHKSLKLAEYARLEHFLPHFMLGKDFNDRGESEKSLHLLSQAHQILPSQLTLMQLGKCFQRLNQLPSAEKCFQQAINCDLKDTAAAWKHLYDIYMKQKRLELIELCIENSNCF